MAPTEAEAGLAPLVEMQETDVPAGFALSEEAGWNQTAEDWSLLIRLGRAFGIPGSEGRLVATGLALPYPSAFGWIGMVIVHGPYRRRGLATRLMERSLAELRDRGLVPFLDATPAGRPVYERMGFRAVEALTRWRGQGGGPEAHDLPPLVDVAEIAELDRAAFGVDRSAVLADLLARKGALSRRDPGGDGFLLARTGRTATLRRVPSSRARRARRCDCSSRRWPRSPARCWSTCPTARRRSPACSPSAGSSPSGPSRGWRSTRTRVSAIPRWFAPSRHRSSG